MSSSAKIYVGNIPSDTREEELDDKFSRYGKILSIWIARNPPGYAFVQYDEPRDAEDAMRDMDGRDFLGKRIRVELSRAKPRDRSRDRDERPRGGEGGRFGRHPGYRPGEFRVIVKGLSSRCSWQDLKDFLRRGGEICYADVRDGEGVADFLSAEDMDRAIRKLDGTDFQGEPITIVEDRGGSSRDRDRNKGRSRSRDRDDRRGRGRDRSRSRDREDRGRERDRDRDGGRSPDDRRDDRRDDR